MALIVAGSNEFREKVRKAVASICPCYSKISFTAAGLMQFERPNNHNAFCQCYCKHRAGCNLIDRLSNNFSTTIGETSADGSSEGAGNVDWDPNQKTVVGMPAGKAGTPPFIVLAHELVHALRDHLNQPNTEQGTVRDENQVREETLGGADNIRTTYGGEPIANPRAGALDTTDQQDCACG